MKTGFIADVQRVAKRPYHGRYTIELRAGDDDLGRLPAEGCKVLVLPYNGPMRAQTMSTQQCEAELASMSNGEIQKMRKWWKPHSLAPEANIVIGERRAQICDLRYLRSCKPEAEGE